MCSCLYSTVQQPGASLASVEVSLSLFEELWTDRKIARCPTAVFIEVLDKDKIVFGIRPYVQKYSQYKCPWKKHLKYSHLVIRKKIHIVIIFTKGFS